MGGWICGGGGGRICGGKAGRICGGKGGRTRWQGRVRSARIARSMQPLAEIALLSFTTLITMVNPLAVIPPFIAMTHGVSRGTRREIALIAGLATTGVLLGFFLFGNYVFNLFGITIPAFQIMGGIIFFVNALRTLMADERRLHVVTPRVAEAPEERAELIASGSQAADPVSIAVVPLAIPMLAGPGAITSTMVLVNLYRTWPQKLAIMGAIAVVGLIAYIVLLAAQPLSHVIGERGRVVFSKIMALLLGAIGIQFVVNGIRPLMVEMIRAGQ
jgi:multiple antibiotic resistance protein